MEEQKPHLYEVIDFERDIKPYRLIRLYAGVGAGKNEWTEKLAEQGYNILLITSRANTATAQAKKLNAKRHLSWEDIIEAADSWGETPLDRVCCTNSDIEKYAREKYDPDNPKTHIWNLFDFIILDEAHSLTADAGFSEAPFYVLQFLMHAYKKNRGCHIVLMSGTQEPINWVFEGERNQERVHELDYFDQCRHIDPDRVHFWPRFSGIRQMVALWKQGERIIYFANKIDSIKDCIRILTEEGVPEADIGVSYSDKGKDKDFSAELLQKKDRIKDELIRTEHVPKDVKILLTTSTNKEGINIRDEDIQAMFSESCQREELVQMAGRVRSRLKHFVVLYDASQHANHMSQFQEELEKSCLRAVKDSAASYLERNPDKIDSVIETVETEFDAIRYDPFSRKFMMYRGRIASADRKRQDDRKITEYVENYGGEVYYDRCSGQEELQEWFPYSKLDCREPKYGSQEAVIRAVRGYIKMNGYIGKIITKDEVHKLTDELNELLSNADPKFIPSKQKIKNLKSALKYYNLRLDDATGSHNNVKKIIREAETETS